jgi:hypothetical protein
MEPGPIGPPGCAGRGMNSAAGSGRGPSKPHTRSSRSSA